MNKLTPEQIRQSLMVHRRMLAEINLALEELSGEENRKNRIVLHRQKRQTQRLIANYEDQLTDQQAGTDTRIQHDNY